MSYRLGVDLGTTWTAAAVWEGGKASIFPLGQHRAAVPSVVLLRTDGTVLTGDAALRRAMTEPERVAREFKRRIGDTTPIIVAGTPYPAEALTARLLRSVIDQVAAQQGRAPEQVVIAHPANWGAYKLELLNDIARRAGLDPDACGLITEPEAAAITYAGGERIAIGQNVCVYDLGGGTFDVAVLQRTTDGFAILGRPDGIERLGGIDFDAAIYAHVTSLLGAHYQDLDPDDPLTLSAIARLRQDCVEAKEALSADTDTTIPVLLPNHQTELRLTRSEFESLIRPTLQDTIETTRRAIASSGLETGDIHHILLVGGSSRIPLISQLVQRELDLPTTIDADPKHAIALGTATFRLPALGGAPAASPPAPRSQSSEPAPAPGPGPVPGSPVPGGPASYSNRGDVYAAPRSFPPGELPGADRPAAKAPVIDFERTIQAPAPTERPSRPTPRTPAGIPPAARPAPGLNPPGTGIPPAARPAPGGRRDLPPPPAVGSVAPARSVATPDIPVRRPPPPPPSQRPGAARPVAGWSAQPGPQPLISSKAGSRPPSNAGSQPRPSASGPQFERAAAPVAVVPPTKRRSRLALALMVMMVALMLGFGAYLLTLM